MRLVCGLLLSACLLSILAGNTALSQEYNPRAGPPPGTPPVTGPPGITVIESGTISTSSDPDQRILDHAKFRYDLWNNAGSNAPIPVDGVLYNIALWKAGGDTTWDGNGIDRSSFLDIGSNKNKFCGWKILEESSNNAKWTIYPANNGVTIKYQVDPQGGPFDQKRSWLKLGIAIKYYIERDGMGTPKCEDKIWHMKQGEHDTIDKPTSPPFRPPPQVAPAAPAPCSGSCQEATITLRGDFGGGDSREYRVEDMRCSRNNLIINLRWGQSFPQKVCLSDAGFAAIRYRRNEPGRPFTQSTSIKPGDIVGIY